MDVCLSDQFIIYNLIFFSKTFSQYSMYHGPPDLMSINNGNIFQII